MQERWDVPKDLTVLEFSTLQSPEPTADLFLLLPPCCQGSETTTGWLRCSGQRRGNQPLDGKEFGPRNDLSSAPNSVWAVRYLYPSEERHVEEAKAWHTADICQNLELNVPEPAIRRKAPSRKKWLTVHSLVIRSTCSRKVARLCVLHIRYDSRLDILECESND